MLNELKFVQGSVAKKELLPSLTHFKIEDGHIRGFNGTIAISAPKACAIVLVIHNRVSSLNST